MGLSHHFTLCAPATAKAEELVAFLKSVEKDAKAMGFEPTMVLDAVFDTPERREFAFHQLRENGYARVHASILASTIVMEMSQKPPAKLKSLTRPLRPKRLTFSA